MHRRTTYYVAPTLDFHADQVDNKEGHQHVHKAAQLETHAVDMGWYNLGPGTGAAMPSTSTRFQEQSALTRSTTRVLVVAKKFR